MDSVDVFTLPWRAKRDYVLGADMADAMLDALSARGPLLEPSFSVHEMIRTHRAEMFALGPDETARLAEFPVRLRVRLGGEIRHFALRPVDGADGPEGVDDHEADIWAAACREGETIASDGPFPLSPLTTAVSLKKRLMLDLFPERRGKWTFCRLDAPAPPPADPPRISVRFRQTIRSVFLSEVVFGDAPPARMQFMVTE